MVKSKLDRFKEGLQKLTPAQLAHSRMVGCIGAAGGLVLALVTMFMTNRWYFTLFILFMIHLQVVSAIQAYQQWEASKRMMDIMEIEELGFGGNKNV